VGSVLLDRLRSRPAYAALAIAALKLALHLAFLRPYGIFRDELYYVACADHLAWGYVDQPPLCVFVLSAWRVVFGDSLASIRVLAALAGTATVFVTGLLTIEMGGGLLAVVLAGGAVLTAGQFLSTAHYYSMNVLDQLFWAVAAYTLVLAIVPRSASQGRWLVLGLVLGFGLLNKTSVLWLGAGLVATPARDVLRTRGPYVAAAVAALVFSPYVVWEIRHGWPTLEFMKNAMGTKYAPRSLPHFVREQLEQNNLFAAPIWLAGLYALLARRLGARIATLGWAYLAVFAIVASQKAAKAEYLSPSYPMLMSAGGVFWERTFAKAARTWAPPVAFGLMILAMAFGGLVVTPFALGVLSEEQFVDYQRALGRKPESNERRELAELPQFFADMHGWRELTDLVASVHDALPPEERAHATIWCRSGGYGPAAAIDYFGRGRGLPPALSAHNNYWYWGPGSGDGKAVIVVGGRPDWVSRYFASFERVATFECRYCRPDENHKPIYVGRGMTVPLSSLWPDERYFD
jgi:hypothetical protein